MPAGHLPNAATACFTNPTNKRAFGDAEFACLPDPSPVQATPRLETTEFRFKVTAQYIIAIKANIVLYSQILVQVILVGHLATSL